MSSNPDLLVDENDEGLRRTMNENYAYLMESTSLLYYTERFCNVTMVGDLIDDRNYAIGMRKSMLFASIFSFIVFLIENFYCILLFYIADYKYYNTLR